MEWLQNGTYTFETQRPPLGRVAAALCVLVGAHIRERAGNDPARFDSGVGGFLGPYRLTEVLPGLDQDEAVNGCNGLEILETDEFELFYPEKKGVEACKSTS